MLEAKAPFVGEYTTRGTPKKAQTPEEFRDHCFKLIKISGPKRSEEIKKYFINYNLIPVKKSFGNKYISRQLNPDKRFKNLNKGYPDLWGIEEEYL